MKAILLTCLLTSILLLTQVSLADDFKGDPNLAMTADGAYSDPNIKMKSIASQATPACIECQRSNMEIGADTAFNPNAASETNPQGAPGTR